MEIICVPHFRLFYRFTLIFQNYSSVLFRFASAISEKLVGKFLHPFDTTLSECPFSRFTRTRRELCFPLSSSSTWPDCLVILFLLAIVLSTTQHPAGSCQYRSRVVYAMEKKVLRKTIMRLSLHLSFTLARIRERLFFIC